MKTLGVVGGIASGKSHVAKQFESWGAHRIDGDQLGHLVLEQPDVQAQLKRRWGEAIFDGQDQIDRRAIAKLVFQDGSQGATELAFLESVTHPQIDRRIGEQIEIARKRGQIGVVIDAAIMLKAGWDHNCDVLVFVDATRNVRLRRALERGWTEAEFDAREASQWPIEEKKQRCHYVIDNNGSLASMEEDATRVWTSIFKTPPTSPTTSSNQP